MRKRRLPILILLLLIGAGYWLLRTEPSGQVAEPPVAPQPSAAGSGASLEHAEPEAAATRATAQTAEASADDSSATPVLLTSLHGVPLRVVRAEDNSPIPAAEVWWHSAPSEYELDEQYRDFALAGGLEARLHALGHAPVRADESGRLVLPASPFEFQHAYARSDDLSGMVKLWPSLHHGEELLRLQRTDSIMVRVLTATGEPAVGARVGWEVQAPELGLIPVAETWQLTDERGGAVLRDVARSHFERVPPLGSSWWIAVLEPFEPRIRVRCDAEHPPTSPVELKLPPHGEVIVTAEDAHGDPATDGTHAYLHAVAWNWRYPPHSSQSLMREGSCHFPFVGIGLELVAGADLEQAYHFATARQVGPRSAGELVTIPIQPSATGVRLTGRIVAASSLLADRTWKCDLKIHQPNGDVRSDYGGPLRLRADGSFTYSVREEWLRHAGRAEVGLMPDSPARGVQQVAFAELDWPPPQGITDLGEISVPAELLVAGRVVDAEGDPVPELPLWIAGEQPSARVTPLVGPILSSRLLTDEQGRFRVLGRWPDRADRILYLLDNRLMPSLHFTRGESELLLTLPALTTIHGRLVLPDGARYDGLVVEARITTPGETSTREELSMPREEGDFHFRALPAGQLEISLRGAEPPFRLPALAAWTISGAAEERPAPLNPLDLRSRLRSCTIEVRSRSGEALSNANFLFQNPAGPMVGRRYALPITLTIPIGQEHAASCSEDGYSSAPVDWSLPHQVIVLDPFPRVRLRISGLPERSDGYDTVELTLERRDESGRVPWSKAWTLSGTEPRELWVPEPGDYFARLELLQKSPGARTRRVPLSWHGADELPFEVPAGDSATDLLLAVGSDALAAALTALRAR